MEKLSGTFSQSQIQTIAKASDEPVKEEELKEENSYASNILMADEEIIKATDESSVIKDTELAASDENLKQLKELDQ